MEQQIRRLLLNKFRQYFEGRTLEIYDEHILKIISFHPFEFDFEDLNNISGIQVTFICYVKGKIQGVVKRNRTYEFNFNGVAAIIKENQIQELDISNITISNLEQIS